MNYSKFARDGRQRETMAISGAVKAMAKELEVPVMVLSQLSRATEGRGIICLSYLICVIQERLNRMRMW